MTATSHCLLVPYWLKQLSKTDLQARQLSPRGGYNENLLDFIIITPGMFWMENMYAYKRNFSSW